MLDVKYHSGADPVAMHNYYTLLYNKCVFEVLEKKLETQSLSLARSQLRRPAVPCSLGEIVNPIFEAMVETLRGGLSLTLCGYGLCRMILEVSLAPDPAVYKRWCAFGLLSSHSSSWIWVLYYGI